MTPPLDTKWWHVVNGVKRPLGTQRLQPDTDPPPTGGTIYAGAVPLGTAEYTPVGVVRYVATNGSNANSGNIDSPWVGIQHAINNTPSGGTIVLRGGIHYQGSLTAPSGKTLRIQNYPGEAVWIDGTYAVTVWTQNGGTWTAPYSITHPRFDVTGRQGAPFRNYPDQVWVDTTPLTQVEDATTPGAGQFSVNQNANTLTIGTNPSGKTIRAVQHQNCLISSGRVDLFGIGIRRFSPPSANFPAAMVYYGGTSEGLVIENCHFAESFVVSLQLTKDDGRVTSNTIRDGGYSGFFATTADRLLVEKNLIIRVNRSLWAGAPETACVKITRCDQPVVRWNYVADCPNGSAYWYDVSNIRTKMYGNYADGRSVGGRGSMGTVLFQEISDGGYLGGVQHRNYVVGNYVIGGNGNSNVASSYTEWWNNTLTESEEASLLIYQWDYENDGVPASNRTNLICPWRGTNVHVVNNDIDLGAGAGWRAGIRAYDGRSARPAPYAAEWTGWDMVMELSGNWLRPGPGSGVNMVELGRLDSNRSSFNSQSALAISGANVGGPPGSKLGPNHVSATAPTSQQVQQTALPLPADIAEMVGVPEGTRLIGHNQSTIPVIIA